MVLYIFYQEVLNGVLAYISEKNPDLVFLQLISGYKRFDPTRGMEYKLDLLLSHPAEGISTYRYCV